MAYYSYHWSEEIKVEKITIIGNSFIPAEEIKTYINDSIFSFPKNKINLDEIKRNILNHPFISEAFISLKNLNEINIEVKEKIPEAILISNTGEPYFSCMDGSILPYRVYRNLPDIPIISGLYYNNYIDSISFKNSLIILKTLKNQYFDSLYKVISELKYNNKTSQFEMYGTESGLKFIFGKSENIEKKFSKLYVFWRTLLREKSSEKFKYIDLRWNDIVVTSEI